MTCSACGGFVPVREVAVAEATAPELDGTATCVRCNAPNVLTRASLFVIDGQRMRRIKLGPSGDPMK